jgi:protein-S-isoprenylcysteine O-methyltransferase Ste14
MNVTKHNILSVGQLLLTSFYVLIFPTLVLFLASDWHWLEGWIFSVWYVSMTLLTLIYLYRNDPALLQERFKQPGTGNEKAWDWYFLYAIQILFWSWIVIMPLDAKRFGWSPDFPIWLKSLGGIALVPAFFLFYRSFTDNTFLSPVVRIQAERKQRVVSTGVYGFVRHPMYLGGICFFFGTPILLGSQFGILLGLVCSLLLVARIVGEEKMLVEELEGYVDYKTKVKYRLLPLVW